MIITINKKKIDLNDILIRRQKMNKDDLKEVIKIHRKKESIFTKMNELNPKIKIEYEKILKYSFKINKLDLEVQKAWKFKRNDLFLTWWFQIPHCSCSTRDNWNNLGKGYIKSPSCIIHGRGLNNIVLTEKSVFN